MNHNVNRTITATRRNWFGRVVMAAVVLLGGVTLGLAGPTPIAAADVAAAPAQVVVTLVATTTDTIADVATRTGTTLIDTLPGKPTRYLLQANDARTADQLLLAVGADPAVAATFANGRVSAPEVRGFPQAHSWAAAPPSDATNQYAVDLLGLTAANAISTGAGVTVAIVDTGVQLLPSPHAALAAAMVPGVDVVDADGVPDDARPGLVDPVNGLVDAASGHGTHVAGIVHLVAPAAAIMPVRVLDSTGAGSMWDVVKGMEWAADHGATIINASFGARGSTALVRYEIAALVGRGVVVVGAAGNDGRDRDNVPAAARCAISVTASQAADVVAPFATTGSSVDLAAPGVSITSAHPFSPTGFASWSGSSMAAPFAAGTAALVRSIRPSSAGEMLALLAGTAKPVLNTVGSGTFGRLDPVAALTNAAANTIPNVAAAKRCTP